MDSFELNKIAGAILGTLTFTLGLSIVSDIIFSHHPPEKPGFEIVVKEASSGEAQAAAPADVPIANLLGAANVERGAAQAKKCGACHNFVEGAGAKVGPDLYNIVGRQVASAPGFAYSAAMKAHGGTWTFQELSDFIKNPKADIPGTAMGFAGLAKETDRADLLAYLNTLSHSPQPLPKPEPAAAPAGAAPAAGEKPAETKPAEPAAAPAAPAPAAPAPAPPATAEPKPAEPATSAPAHPSPAPGDAGAGSAAPPQPQPAPVAPAAPATPPPQ